MSRPCSRRLVRAALLALTACHPDTHVAPTDDAATDASSTDGADTDAGDTAGTDTARDDTDDVSPSTCRETPRPADGTRAVIVSLPYGPGGGPSYAWEVLDLDRDGVLSRPGRTFTMGRAAWGTVAFSPDGSLGIVPQDDGTLGIFTLDAQRRPTVVASDWNGDGGHTFYANEVFFDETGGTAWVVDEDWAENGGGIYEIALDCATGEPSLVREVLPSKLAHGAHRLADGRLVVVADEVDDQADGDVFLVDPFPVSPHVSPGAVLFDYDDALVGGHALMSDDRFVLVGDHSEFSGVDNRLAWAALDGTSPVGGTDTIAVLDPFSIVASPFGDAALVASGYGDALYALSYDPDADPPFTDLRALSYVGADPALPGSMVVVHRGAREGLVLVSENTAIRRVQFDGAGGATDLGAYPFGAGLDDIPGAIGVQP